MFDFLDLTTLLYRVPALLIALTLHEYGHAYVSDSLGDPTPSLMGRLSVNPLRHLDVMGTIMLVIFGFGWAKPVEINPRYYQDYRRGVLKVAAAGPGMNFFLCFIAVFLMSAFHHFGLLEMAGYQLLYWIMLYNVWFALFNLIPIPPLDGSKILAAFLPGDLAYQWEAFNYRYGFFLLMLVVFSGLTGRVLGPLSNGYVELCYRISRFIF